MAGKGNAREGKHTYLQKRRRDFRNEPRHRTGATGGIPDLRNFRAAEPLGASRQPLRRCALSERPEQLEACKWPKGFYA